MEDIVLVYVIVDETLCWGAWIDPRDAAKWYLGFKPLDPDMDIATLMQLAIDEMVKELLDTSDYPMLAEVPVNPRRYEEPWSVSIEGNMLIAKNLVRRIK